MVLFKVVIVLVKTVGNNNLASIMALDFGRAGTDEAESRCKPCETKSPIAPQTKLSAWSCTYDELGQGAANGCPRCSNFDLDVFTEDRKTEKAPSPTPDAGSQESTAISSEVLLLLELNKDSIVLRENVGDVQYACPSHCWGKNPADTIRTTKQTLESFKEGITESNLNVNFRDAIDVCRALDIKYLWIDSPCITQDQKGKEDWNNQAAKMAEYYKNAHVTIAATRSADSSGGCYSRRHPKHLAKSVPGYEGVFASLEPPSLPVDFKRFDMPLSLPLLERGWVYQEMRLSRRVLHFCDEQVVWICQTSRRSESKCHDGIIDHNFKDKRGYSYEYMPYDIPSSNPKLLWYRYVHECSRLRLTYPSRDRMAALDGLAKRMQDSHKIARAIKDSCLSQAPYTAPTKSKDLTILEYKPDRKAQEHQAETGGLLLVVTRRAGAYGLAQAIHVKLRSDGETYEHVGFELDESEEDEEHHSDISLWDMEPWNAFPLMEVTLV
ncbi:tol protein [Diaporthe eres]|nr:tol protein [Diaporthe eres]